MGSPLVSWSKCSISSRVHVSADKLYKCVVQKNTCSRKKNASLIVMCKLVNEHGRPPKCCQEGVWKGHWWDQDSLVCDVLGAWCYWMCDVLVVLLGVCYCGCVVLLGWCWWVGHFASTITAYCCWVCDVTYWVVLIGGVMGVEWLRVMCDWQVALVDSHANEFTMLKMGMLNSKFRVLCVQVC